MMKNIIDILKTIARQDRRHTQLWRQTKDWSVGVGSFIEEYKLAVNATDYLLENSRQSKLELIELTYRGNKLVRMASTTKDSRVLSILVGVVNELENMRRALISPVLQNMKLTEIAFRLNTAYGRLQERLATLELL
jgi:hypothetical protein